MIENSIIIIPVRKGSTRLPNKFCEDIAGKPMIIRVLERAMLTGIKCVIACDDEEHKEFIESFGYSVIMTNKSHQSGTDRIAEALEIVDPDSEFEYVVNLQGDLPFINPNSIMSALSLFKDPNCDIGTLCTKIIDEEEITDPNVVKIALGENGRALYFSRSPIPHGATEFYHHLGLYAFKRESLKIFVSFSQTGLEKLEKLEQLRAMENGLNINVAIMNDVPISVDTPKDLAKAREYAKRFV